ncbi:MAG TPA: NPCBM/NEW2 domain-containing protein [Chthonomonadales bacterium]|nr:NPCBM/NEW2 domain-containing protein [Chthonomonadales bacterium]
MLRTGVALALIAMEACAMASPGVRATPAEMEEARRWTAARLLGEPDARPPLAGLTVLANNDPVQRNARAGRALNIAGKAYTRGLYCHAVSKVVVRLPGAGSVFHAVTGVDSNEQTSGGRGSVVFAVTVGGRQAYRGRLMREGMAGAPVRVALGGASEFTLEVEDGGDGISCDQANWADAGVEMADGSTVWLGDLPIDGGRPGYTPEPPFSFIYGGRPSAELLPGWRVERSSRVLDEHRTGHRATYTDPETGLQLTCDAVQYGRFPTVEWVLKFRNTGTQPTPILEAVRAVDTRFERALDGEFTLRHWTGSPCLPTDYHPHVTPLPPGASLRIATLGGRSTNSDLPNFNIGWPGEGVLVVLGWPGQWDATFARDGATGLRVTGGQERIRLSLSPGEQIRTPLVVVQFYSGGPVRAQNVWRRWMLAHNTPRPGGKEPPPQFVACSSHQFGEMIDADSASQKRFIDRYLEEGLKLDYWWMDAGWYPNNGGWPNTGTWEVDQGRFPGGLRPITDHGRARGVRSIVWFEPERVNPGTWLYNERPQWLLGGGPGDRLLNLGNPEALAWLTDHVDGLIRSEGIDLYRHDFNFDPLPFWRAADAPDRQGITEIRYVEGFLAYWDELRRRHPSMLIDTCASGGRRNDIETLRRSVPLLRSDYIIEPVGNQNHTYGISSWIPYWGTGSGEMRPYWFRSVMGASFNACFDMRRKDLPYDTARKLYREWRAVADLFLRDYYPLTPYATGQEVWMAWQFDDPEGGRGMVQAFRRADSPYESARFRLQGLDPDATYAVTDVDRPRAVRRVAGSELMERGLSVAIADQPGAALLTYRRVGGSSAAGPRLGAEASPRP